MVVLKIQGAYTDSENWLDATRERTLGYNEASNDVTNILAKNT